MSTKRLAHGRADAAGAVGPFCSGRAAALAALVAVMVTGLAYWLGVWTVAGQRAEDRILRDADTLLAQAGPYLDVSSAGSPFVLGCCVLIVVITGLVGRGLASTGAALAVLLGGVAAAWLLKMALSRPHLARTALFTVNSFPSGHVALAMSFVLALLLATPVADRFLVAALGAVGACVVTTWTLMAAWHRPSDVVGAAMVSATVFLLCVTILGRRATIDMTTTTAVRWSSVVYIGIGSLVVAVGCPFLLLQVLDGPSGAFSAQGVELLIVGSATDLAPIAVIVLAAVLLRPGLARRKVDQPFDGTSA